MAEQLVVHHDFGDAAIGQAAHEAGAADVLIVELQAQARGQQYAERRHHPHQLALLVGGFQHDHGEAGVGAVLGHHALDQGALLALRARRGVAADLPVAMDRPHRALRAGRLGQAEQERRSEQAAEPAGRFQAKSRLTHSRLMFRTPHPGRSLLSFPAAPVTFPARQHTF